jgi:hypothetical protein
MQRAGQLVFKPEKQLGLCGSRKELGLIKQTVSLTLDIHIQNLNEISLEDVEIDAVYQQRIYQTLFELAVVDEVNADDDGHEREAGIPCTGFWVEPTHDLILYAWNSYKTKTIVIPGSEWVLREDITIH